MVATFKCKHTRLSAPQGGGLQSDLDGFGTGQGKNGARFAPRRQCAEAFEELYLTIGRMKVSKGVKKKAGLRDDGSLNSSM